MPKDARLYMTFPIDFPDHPKVKPLSPLAKWTFVEMNAYSRRLGLDGCIPVDAAHAMWKRPALAALVGSHPVKPLVRLVDDNYVMPDYAEHQMTTADIEELRVKRANAGAAGGRAKAQAKQPGSKPLASATAKSQQTLAESESRSESEILTDVTNDFESSHLPDAGAEWTDPIPEFTVARAAKAGIRDLAAVAATLHTTTNKPVSPLGAVLLTEAITSKAKAEVRNVDAYVAQVCRKSPGEVAEAYFDLDIEGVA